MMATKSCVTSEEYGRPMPNRLYGNENTATPLRRPVSLDVTPRSSINYINIDWSKVRPYRGKQKLPPKQP